jgi:hypothetical protein
MDQDQALPLGAQIAHGYTFEAFRNGVLLWREEVHNLVVTEGRNAMLTQFYKGSGYTAAHYIGLKSAGAINAADTMASHAAWTEVQTYDEAARPTLAWGTASAGSLAASGASTFTISGTVTVAGGFITTVATKGGTTGTLIGATDFAAARDLIDNDVLNVTPTATLTAA